MIANIGIRLSAEEKASLAAIAKRTDTTISQIMRRLIPHIYYSAGRRRGRCAKGE